MVHIFELWGGIPIGIAVLKQNPFLIYFIAVFFNLIPVFPVLLFLNPVKKLLEISKPDVVIAMTDVIAIGAYRFLREHDIKVPEDVGLVGFSDLKGTDLMAVPLTTVREPTEEIGKRAIEILMDQIDDPDCEIRQEKLGPKLVVRESA